MADGLVSGRSRLDAGAILGGYRVELPLSSGGQGTVYAGRRDRDGQAVALKVLEGDWDPGRFEIETRLLALLTHPRVVPVVDHFVVAGRAVIVMERVEGRDLARVLREEGSPGLPAPVAISHVRQAAEAVEYLHEQLIVHRDVKPANLIASPDGVVVVDFGVARTVGQAGEKRATAAIGTPGFMSPEVLVGEQLSPRTDVFGLAATLWMLLTGAPPRYGEARAVSSLAADVSPELDACLLDALQLFPEQRTPSARAFADASANAWRPPAATRSPPPVPSGRRTAVSSKRSCGRRQACSTPPRAPWRCSIPMARRSSTGGRGRRRAGRRRDAHRVGARASPVTSFRRAGPSSFPTVATIRASPRTWRRPPATSRGR